MATNIKKKITVVICSCANCPRSDWSDETKLLYCLELKKFIKPSKAEPMAIYFHDIPDNCPFPNTNDWVT
jgi:hypothetical protein